MKQKFLLPLLAVAILSMAFTAYPSDALPPAITPENASQLVTKAEVAATSLRKAVFSPDGTLVAVGSGNDTDFGISIRQSDGLGEVAYVTGLTGIVWDLAFSPDGRYIASAANDTQGRHLRIWKASDGSQVTAIPGFYVASSVAFSPDGSRLAVGLVDNSMKGLIYIYDTHNWSNTVQLKAGNQNVTALAYSPDGTRLISSGTDGNIRIWPVGDWGKVKMISAGKQANRMAYSPDGLYLATNFCVKTNEYGCTAGGVAVWNTKTWTAVKKFNDLAETLAFTPDSRMLVTGSGANDAQMRFRKVEDWTLVHSIPGNTVSVALSPDNRRLVSLLWDKIILWGVP
jgi:WD40 repeat protein